MTPTPEQRKRLRRRPLGRYRYTRLRWRVAFALVDWVGAWLFALGSTLRRWFSKDRTNELPAEPEVVLLVQLDHLGDAILTTSMLPWLRRQYPSASIEVLASPWNREVFDAAAEVDWVHVFRWNRFARGVLPSLVWVPAIVWQGWRLRRRRIGLAVDVRGDFPIALMLWIAGAKRRVGWSAGGGGFLLSESAEFVPNRPELESRRALLEKLGIEPADDDRLRPRFHPSPWARRQIRGWLTTWLRQADKLCEESNAASKEVIRLSVMPDHHMTRNDPGTPALRRPLIVLHIGAGTPAKQWPVEHWRELLGRVAIDHHARVVLVGNARERRLARRILQGRRWPGVLDGTGWLSLDELAALIELADLFVGADSGPAHLAASVDTPVVALFSGTNRAEQWSPVGRQVVVLREPAACSPCHREQCRWREHPCMRNLSPKRVTVEVGAMLQTTILSPKTERNPT